MSAADVSIKQFKNVFFQKKPVLLTGMLDDWEAKNWTPEYLRQRVGDIQVPVNSNDTGVFYPKEPNEPGGYVTKNIPVSELLDSMENPSKSEAWNYLQQRPLLELFPVVGREVGEFKYMENKHKIVNTALWMGSLGCISPLHIDLANNFFAQIYGKKEFTLFSPSDTPNLYQAVDQKNFHLSYVTLHKPDLVKHPLLEKAQPYTVTVEAGDVLYIPVKWWHFVQTIQSSISINQWWLQLLTLETLLVGCTHHKNQIKHMLRQRKLTRNI